MKIIYSYQGKETVRSIANETVLIGRGAETETPDLDLSPDTHVSRKHALLTERHGAIWIEDLGSKAGTTVNGKAIKGQGEWRLRPEDVIEIGDTTLRAELRPEPPTAPPAPPPPPPPVPIVLEADAATGLHIEIALDVGEPPIVPAARPGLELERRLALLVDLPAQFSIQTKLEGLLQLVLRRLVEVIPEAERGAVLLRGADDKELLVKACVSPSGPAVSGTLARRAIEEGRGFIWRRNLGRSTSSSIVEHQIATGMYAPLRYQDQTLGVICVDSPRPTAVFNRDDLRLLMAVAQYAALAVSNYQLQEEVRRIARLTC